MISCSEFVPHSFRNICLHCRQPKWYHEFDPNHFNEVRIALNVTQASHLRKSEDYVWIPMRCPDEKLEEFFDLLPELKITSNDTDAIRSRQVRFMTQIPAQDVRANFCRFLSEDYLERFQDFVDKRNSTVLKEAIVKVWSSEQPIECQRCQKVITRGDLVIMTLNLGEDIGWHPNCFTCSDCREIPVDLIFCLGRVGRIYCVRHHDNMNKDRCNTCDELIFDKEYTHAFNKTWHLTHFCCLKCDAGLVGERYLVSDGEPYCVECYNTTFCNVCHTCGEKIIVGQTELEFEGRHWHKQCLTCNLCKKSLQDTHFAKYQGELYCVPCYEDSFSPCCDKCHNKIPAMGTRLEYRGRFWHKECFTCCQCDTEIEEMSFVPKGDQIYCMKCYEKEIAPKCQTCQKGIMRNGVKFKGKSYHKDCLKCTNCDQVLTKKTVFAHEDNPYCKHCYENLFSKTCDRCGLPITGETGSKYVSFNDMNYHYACFKCSKCEISLVGAYFSPDEDGFLCSNCAYKKLHDSEGP